MSRPDPFDLDVLREAFLATSNEMFVAMQRSSQSPLIYEVLDFAVGLTDAEGQLVSQGNGVAGFLGPLGDAVGGTLARLHDLAPGDVVATNDPFAGGGTHLSDVALVRPLFHGPTLVGFAACKGHWTEIGGKDPGSWSADATEIFQEGLQLPFVRFVRGGTLDRDLLEILRVNSRLPDQTAGDLFAALASLEVADRRLAELCGRYGADVVTRAMAEVLERSEQLALEALATLPAGIFEAEDFLDDDGLGGGPVPVRVRVEVTPGAMVCDFTGSHRQVAGPVNCTRSALNSGVRTVFKAVTDPSVPASDGWFRPLRIVCPPGTVFSAERPAAVGAFFEAEEMASDLVWKALAPVLPDVLTAGSFLSVCSTSLAFTDADGSASLLVEPQAGGWGASSKADGEHGLVSVGDGETYTVPIEVAEQRFPLRVERFGLDIVAGAGAGEHRGGRGLVREYRVLSPTALLTTVFGRHRFPPWATGAGRPGSPNYVEVCRGDGSPPARFGSATRLPLEAGDLVRLVTGTGGGSGDPRRRDRRLVSEDLLDGLVSEEDARDIYGLDADSAAGP